MTEGDDSDLDEDLADARRWLRRAILLTRREPGLRRRIATMFAGGTVLGPAVNVLDVGITLAAVLDGLFVGFFAAVVFALITVENRMEAVFPDYGDDEADDADDSLRAQYVRGDIDHETFKRRLDQKLRESPTPESSVASDPASVSASDATADAEPNGAEAILRARLARGEIDEAEFRSRLDALRETDATPETGTTRGDEATRGAETTRETEPDGE